jgi:6-pyruvoyltetrahydropterin/6-carboxytetrahydropterin synthase
MTIYLTRKEEFNAAHKLWVDDWSEEKNKEIFGKCANPYFHGHNYELFVTVKGKPDPITGFIIDAKLLSQLIRDNITEVLDHTNLNKDKNFIPQNLQPTTENVVYYIWKELEPFIPANCKLHCIKLQETPRIYAEYYGEEG